MEERKHHSALRAVRSYRIRNAQVRQKWGRVEVLEERLAAIEGQLKAEGQELAEQEKTLGGLLASAGVQDAGQWHALCEQAREFRELRTQRTALEEQLETLLHGEDIETLRAAVEASGRVPEPPAEQDAAALKAELARVAEAIEARQKEEHALHIQLTERSTGARSLSEIEEERVEVGQRVQELERELEASSYAAAVIEEVARDKHARIAPPMASLASEFLGEITDGAYEELLINRDLGISVRVPQTARMNDAPERSLSKGTVDQIYLALRLAMVQGLSEDGERIPMLLDDPFANYDDRRLERAMRLLVRLGEKNQILVFTCRDDVVRAANAVSAPILELSRRPPCVGTGQEGSGPV